MKMPPTPWKSLLVLYLLALVAIGAANPWTIHGLMGGGETITSKVKWLILLFDLCLLLLPTLYLVFRGRPKIRNAIVNLAVLLGSVLGVLAAAKVTDLALGSTRRSWDLIYSPNSSARYVTPEFDYTAEINRFGFRGPKDIETPTAETFNVLMVGDSFTFGWGLAYEDTWPALVEERLRAEGLQARIFNLGKPGSSPALYSDLVERASQLLEPDLIIINILQGDDLQLQS